MSFYFASNNISSLSKSVWGQSFQAECNGKLSSISFNSANQVSSSATVSIYQGTDCNGSILYSQSISSISDGDNTISLINPISVIDEDFYYFKVQTDNGIGWKVRFNDSNEVEGNLRTYYNNKSSSSCGWSFSNYDWDFSTIINSQAKLKSNTGNDKLSKKDVIVIENKFWIYPNPTSGNISIESDIPVTQAEFYSVLGKRVKNVISDFNSISIDNLDHGIYFVKIRTDEGFKIERIIKN